MIALSPPKRNTAALEFKNRGVADVRPAAELRLERDVDETAARLLLQSTGEWRTAA